MGKNDKETIQVREDLYEIKQHGSLDYPVAVYRIDLNMMYLNLIHWHWHSEIELIVIKEGSAEFSAGDNVYILSPGDTLFINRIQPQLYIWLRTFCFFIRISSAGHQYARSAFLCHE